jgi:peptidylprolyl isomerase
MAQVKQGDTVRVHYTGKLNDGTVFDSSAGGEPLEFTVGSGQIIPGFESAVTGLTPGDKTTALVPSDQAYGPHREEGIIDVPRDRIPAEITPEVGQQLQMQSQDGRPVPVRVIEVEDASIKVDANHPLAGKDLTFEIELVEIAA